MKALQVKCPNCKKIMHNTSEHFDPNVRCNGSMLRLINPWRKWGWCSFGASGDGRLPKQAEVKGTLASDMRCPSCDAPLAPSGYLTVLNEDGSPFVFVAPEPEPYKGYPVVRVYEDEELEREWNERLKKDVPQKLEVPKKSRDQVILEMLSQKKTQGEIAKKLGVSGGRISQIIKRLKRKK